MTLARWFSGHSFKLEAEDFILHIPKRKFSKFRPENTFVFCVQQEVFGAFIFPYFVLSWYILAKNWLKCSENGTNRNNKLSFKGKNSYK